MLRIAICDDEVRARDAMWMQLSKLLWEGSEEVVYDFSSGKSAVNWLRSHPGEIDLLFLDVEMEGMNGMETAEQIREFEETLLIVFVTGYADYVFDGYRVGALDYLMKPVQEERLAAVLKRVREKMYREDERSFVVKNTEGTYRFSHKDILYFYSDRRKVTLVTAGGEYAFYDKLDAVEARLGEDFVRIHQRYLVHADAVSHIGGSSVEIGERTLPVSRSLRESAAVKLAKAMLVELWAAGGHGIFGRRHGGLYRRSGESPADISCASSYYMGLLLRQRMEEDLHGTAFRQYSVCMERHCR